MALSREQQRVLNTIVRVGRRTGAPRKHIKAAIETGLVEANLTNPRGGHGTSVGWRQEIDTYGSVGRRRNVAGAARRFFQEAKQKDRGQSSGKLAQDVQRSAYPGRYAQRAGEAGRLLRSAGAGGGGGGARTRTVTTPGVDRSEERRAVLQSYFSQRGRPGALLALSEGLKATKSTPSTTRTVKGAREADRGSKSGSKKAGIVEIGKLAQSMGLHVGENPKFGGVKPVHTPTSWHYKGRAVDVSGDPEKMRRFAKTVARRYGKRTKELFYNGPGGVNIKNGKRVGKGFVSGHTDHVHVAE